MQNAEKKNADGSPNPILAQASQNPPVIVLFPSLFEKYHGRYLLPGCLSSEVRLLEHDEARYLLMNLTGITVHELLHWAVGGQAKSTILLSL